MTRISAGTLSPTATTIRYVIDHIAYLNTKQRLSKFSMMMMMMMMMMMLRYGETRIVSCAQKLPRVVQRSENGDLVCGVYRLSATCLLDYDGFPASGRNRLAGVM